MARILVVDDSPTMGRMPMACLAPVAPTLDAASTGLEVVEKLSGTSHDPVFPDIDMPGMDDVGVEEFLHRHESLARIPVAVVTTRTEPAVEARLEAVGVRRYIHEPFDPEQIETAARDLRAGGVAP